MTIKQHPALIGEVEAEKKASQRRLPGSRAADNRDHRLRLDFDAHVTDYQGPSSPVGEAESIERDAAREIARVLPALRVLLRSLREDLMHTI